jgi:CHAT domain-containing protein
VSSQPSPPSRFARATLFIAAAPEVASLSALPGAREEGRLLAAEWPESVMVQGDAATPEAFVSGARTHEIVHFAGHVTNHQDPAAAALRLASGSNDDGRLTAAGISEWSSRPPALVVLSACAAASGRPTALGPLSIVRSILGSGVTTVVASLWDADDGHTAPLMIDLYRQLRGDQSPAAAVRHAQILCVRQSLAPRHWAGFQVYERNGFH